MKLRPSDLPLDQRPAVVDRLAALLEHARGRHQRHDRRQPRLDIRSRPDRDRRGRAHCPPDLRGRVRPARGRGRGRGPTVVRRRAADVADPRLHGPGLRGATPRPQAGRLPARRPHRQGRHRGPVRDQPARHLRHAERRAERLRPEDPGPPDDRAGPAGRLADPHHRHQGAEERAEGPALGDEEGRDQAWRGDRHEPADRARSSRWSACRPTTTTSSPAASASRTTRSCSRTPTSRFSTTRPRRTIRPARPTSWWPARARWPTRRSRRARGSARRAISRSGRRASTTGTTAASGRATSTAASATRATRSSSRWQASSGSTASATGRSNTASAP